MVNPERIGDPHGRREEGALIIEVLIGAVVIIIALTAIVSVVLSSAMMRRQNAQVTLAYTAASNTLEELRTLPVDELLSRDSTGFDVPSLSGSGGGLRPLANDEDQLPGKLSVILDSAGPSANIYHAVALIEWAGTNGPQTMRLETLIGERTVQ